MRSADARSKLATQLSGLLLLVALAACGPDPKPPRLEAAAILLADPDTFREGRDQLRVLKADGVSEALAVRAFELAGTMAPGRKAWLDPGLELFSYGSICETSACFETLEASIVDYSPRAAAHALRWLSRLPGRDPVQLLVQTSLTRAAELPYFDASGYLVDDPQHVELLFPALLPLLEHDHTRRQTQILMLHFLELELLSPVDVRVGLDKAVASYAALLDQLSRSQQPADGPSAWRFEENYRELRSEGALLLDLLVYSDGPVEDLLAQTLGFSDPKLQFHAAISLTALGEQIDPAVFEAVAASAEMRMAFYRWAERHGQDDLLPSEYRTQPMLAQAELANWLLRDIGEIPDHIEHMAVVASDPALGVEAEYHLFRYELGDEWLAAVAGPYLLEDIPTLRSYASPFSSFEPWSLKPPEAHLAEVQAILADWCRDFASRSP